MKHTILVLLPLAILLCSCARDPIPTRQIIFYRGENLNQGNPCAIDIIYPYDQQQLDQVIEYGPEKWFTSSIYDRVRKDKTWLESSEWMTRADLENKHPEDLYMVIFAEFTHPDPSPPRGQNYFLVFEEEMDWRARKIEHILVHDGSLERLEDELKRPIQ